MKIKRLKILCLLPLVTLAFLFLPANAIQFEKSDNAHISNLHKLEDDLYAFASNITVDGTVEGDLLAFGFTVVTNGYIDNSASIFSMRFDHTGEIAGGLRVFSKDVTIDGYIGRSILAFGQTFTLGERGLVEKDIVIKAGRVEINGTVKGQAKIDADRVIITGTIEDNIEINARSIEIIAPALIKGDLKYVSSNQAEIDVASGVTILGQTTWDLPDEDKINREQKLTSTVLALSKLIAAFLLGLLLFSFSRKYIDETVNQIKNRFSLSIATGFLALFIFAVVVLILLISVTMIIVGYFLISGEEAALGALLLSVSIMMAPVSSFLTISGGIIFYCGKIVVGILVGYMIITIFNKNAKMVSRLQLLLGLTTLTLIFNLPYIGFIIYLLISITGAGGIIQGIRNCRHEAHFPNGNVPPPPTPPPSNNL